MYDINLVNVESQSQFGKSIDTTKLQSLNRDLKDYNEFLPYLKELQHTSSKILKQFHEFLSKKQRKSSSLPYSMLKKFDMIKNSFCRASQTLNSQTHIYHTNINNRDYQKVHDQIFFKKTLKSYDQKRLWMKNYILKNESIVQSVEQQVTRNMEYQVHKFTQIRNQLNVQRLEHNYDNKLDILNKCKYLQSQNILIKQKIKKLIAKKLTEKTKDNKDKDNLTTTTKQSNILELQRLSPVTSLLYFYSTKQNFKYEVLNKMLKQLKNLNKRLVHNNQQFKLSIDKMNEKIQFNSLQSAIILQQWINNDDNKRQLQYSLKSLKITKTDYFIYLKQLQRHCQQLLKVYGCYFQYSLNKKYKFFKKSVSSSKICKAQPELKIQINLKQKLIRQSLQNYYNQNKQKILQQKQKRIKQKLNKQQIDQFQQQKVRQYSQNNCEKILQREQQVLYDNEPIRQVENKQNYLTSQDQQITIKEMDNIFELKNNKEQNDFIELQEEQFQMT